MEKFSVLYNSLSGHESLEETKEKLSAFLSDAEVEYYDVTKIDDVREFVGGLKGGKLLLVGGDGTLNRFVNDTDGLTVKNVWYFAAGTGNDFWHDLGKEVGDAPICIDEYLKDLPSVTINGKTSKFINGVGYGIDGYCCEVGDKLKAEGKSVNYTSIAIKGLLFGYKPCNATVIVDGEEHVFNCVWIAPTMNGRFYGGGMMPTPDQDRLNAERKVSLCIYYGKGKLRTLMLFPSLFTGEHVKRQDKVSVFSGKEITVKFERPTAAQIDGETVLGVTEYTVRSAALNK